MVDLVVATGKDFGDDRVPGLAAEMAFWVLLSLPTLLLATASVTGFVGDRLGEDVQTQLINRIEEVSLQVFTPETVEETISPILDALLFGGSEAVLSLSFLITLYSASRVLRVVVHAVNIAYDVEEEQPSWLNRILGFVFTVGGLLLGAPLIPLVVAGPQLGQIIEDRLGVDLGFAALYQVLYWPLAFVVVTLLLAAVFHWATPLRTPIHRELPGAILATTLGLAVSAGLRTYTGFAIGSEAIYAPLAAPLAIMIWIWLMSIALLTGAELNAEIEKAYPAGEELREAPSLTDLGKRAVEEVRNRVGQGEKAGS